MSFKDEQARTAITEQASEWFVMNDARPLGAEEAAALGEWLKASPVHVEEFLRIATLARDLTAVGAGPELAVDALLAQSQAEHEEPVRPFTSRLLAGLAARRSVHWPVALAAGALSATLAGWLLWNLNPSVPVSEPTEVTESHFETRHGEQQDFRLADQSVVHLNTDSAITVRYGPHQRLVVLHFGEAAFEVEHEAKRTFKVRAGSLEVLDIGTRFDVRLKSDAAVVTVVAGKVEVAPAGPQGRAGQGVELSANQQLNVRVGQWPVTPVSIDVRRATAWLHRQIMFDHEPLERVADEFNRYAPKPIEITAPDLRSMEVSGVFSMDDTDEFLAFLRSLDGVRVDVTATQIRVSRK